MKFVAGYSSMRLARASAVLAIGFGEQAAANVLLAALVAAATLESVFGYCLGCVIFAKLMQAGVIPERVCEACADLSRRPIAA